MQYTVNALLQWTEIKRLALKTITLPFVPQAGMFFNPSDLDWTVSPTITDVKWNDKNQTFDMIAWHHGEIEENERTDIIAALKADGWDCRAR